MSTFTPIKGIAETLGCKEIQSGISWTWFNGFPSEIQAKAFIAAVKRRGIEHRGIYPAQQGTFDVRIRI